MYIEIGSFAAKARLSELLREVKRGQRFTITLRGIPIADLVPSEQHEDKADVSKAIEGMRTIRKVKGVSAKELAEYIQEGRQ